MACSCGAVVTPSVTPCSACNTICTPSSCDPCGSTPLSTPLTLCGPPAGYCTDGCVDTLTTPCLIYRGPHLGALNLLDGDTLAQALATLNAQLTALIGGSLTVPNFIYTLNCALTADTDVSLVTLTKDGVSQIVSGVQFPNGATALAFLQTVDAGWTFTAPNVYSIQSPSVWTMSMACPG